MPRRWSRPDRRADLFLSAHRVIGVQIERAERIERGDEIVGRALRAEAFDDLVDVFVADIGSLRADELRRAGRKEEQIAIAEEAFGADVVEDDLRVDAACHLEGNAGRDVRFDDAGDHFAGGPLGGQDQVDADGAGHLGDPGDRRFDIGAGDHHQIGELIDDRDDERHLLRDGDIQGSFEFFIDFPAVEGADIAQAQLLQDFIAHLHLLDEPLQSGVSAMRLR